MKGSDLTAIPIADTSWADWRRCQPDTLVLTDDTGYKRDYARNPYAGYEKREATIFPVKFRAKGYHPNEIGGNDGNTRIVNAPTRPLHSSLTP